MKLLFLTGLLLIITCYIYECNGKNHFNDKSPEDRRQILVKNIINKMTKLSLYSFLNASDEDTPKIMNEIRAKLKLASNSTRAHRGDKYVELVMDGIQSIVSSKNKVGVIDSAVNTNAIDSINQALVKEELLRARENEVSNEELDPAKESVVFGNDTCDCSRVEEKLCMKISSLDKFTCLIDQNVIPLKKVCDGENDCTDNSDEEQCTVHANKKLLHAKQTVYEIEKILPKRCLEVQNSIDKVVLKTRKETLINVLTTQMAYLNIVAPIKLQKEKGKPVKDVHEIAQIVSLVGAALEGAFCIRDKYKNVLYRREGSSIDDSFEFKQRPWAPPLCTCNYQLCLQSNCTTSCNTTCWQRHSIKQWVCQTLSGEESVSLDLICDGKVDCVDESDENGCTAVTALLLVKGCVLNLHYGGAGADKFEANKMYNIIIEVLATKLPSNRQLKKIVDLQEAVKNLQAQSVLKKPNAAAVKLWREEAFSRLSSIYEGILAKADNILEVESGYDFLMSVSQKLVEAMKLSKTGNEKVLPSMECHCLGDKCLLTECTEACVRTCAVKTAFTEYSCKGDSGATTPIQNICNGKEDCPEGDDEDKCERDVCRKHHMLVLRNKIQNYRDDRWGHALGEVLDYWKTKTTATIRVAEKMNPVSRHGLKKLVGEVLRELVHTYSTLPKLTRRSADGSLPAFMELTRLIQNVLRECII